MEGVHYIFIFCSKTLNVVLVSTASMRLTCFHNLCWEQKYEKCPKIWIANCQFYNNKNSYCIARTFLRNVYILHVLKCENILSKLESVLKDGRNTKHVKCDVNVKMKIVQVLFCIKRLHGNDFLNCKYKKILVVQVSVKNTASKTKYWKADIFTVRECIFNDT